MPVTPDEFERYRKFTQGMMEHLESLKFDPETVLWHYTTGASLLGILQSGQMHATQVACLNDSTETTYATKLFTTAIAAAGKPLTSDDPAGILLDYIQKFTEESAGQTSSSPSKFFVACFTTQQDDLSQWRAYSEPGGENGFSIGFRARGLFVGPNSLVAKVNYEKQKHEAAAMDVAETTLKYFREGLLADPTRKAEQWAHEFFTAWDDHIYRLAPLIKVDAFRSENEFRIVHELQSTELHMVRFRQKKTLLSRHIPLSFPIRAGNRVPMLPLTGIVVGPSRQREVSRVSVSTLLRQMGYGSLPVEISKMPLQLP